MNTQVDLAWGCGEVSESAESNRCLFWKVKFKSFP